MKKILSGLLSVTLILNQASLMCNAEEVSSKATARVSDEVKVTDAVNIQAKNEPKDNKKSSKSNWELFPCIIFLTFTTALCYCMWVEADQELKKLKNNVLKEKENAHFEGFKEGVKKGYNSCLVFLKYENN